MATSTRSRTVAWAADPVAFYRDVLRVGPLYPKQVEVLEAVRDNSQVAVCGANGTGKGAPNPGIREVVPDRVLEVPRPEVSKAPAGEVAAGLTPYQIPLMA